MALVRLETSRWELEIRGPHEPTAGVMAGVDVDRSGILRLSGHPPDIQAEYRSTSGERRMWEATNQAGPVFFEDTTYHLYLAAVAHAPSVSHRDPLFSRDLSFHPKQRVVSGTFNLGRQVGETTFEVRVGPERFSITVEVVPTKIDYATDYRVLVEEVQATSRALALAFMRSTHQSVSVGVQTGSPLEWMASLRNGVEDLSNAVHHINRRPYRHLLRGIESEPSHRLRRPDAVARRSIMRGKGSGGADHVHGVGPVRETLPAVVARATLDTPEHRWIADQVHAVEQRLQQMARGLRESSWTTDSGQVSARDEARLREVRQLARRMEQLGRVEALVAASRLEQAAPPSLTLMSAPGYREAFRILTSLRLALELQGDALELELKDLHDLYEIWCFLEVVAIVARLSGSDPEVPAMIGTSAGGLRVRLKQGVQSDVVLRDGGTTLTLSYNRTYNGETGSHRPDIVLVVGSPGRPELVVALDAKYRVDASTAFRRRHGAPGPPIDAVNELHRYRDAIVGEVDSQLYRPTVRGAALFPLTEVETPGFVDDSSLYRSLQSLGIGALPFLPGNTSLLEAWLTELLSLPDDELSWNGPPGPAAVTR